MAHDLRENGSAPMNVLIQEQILDELAPRIYEVAPACSIVPMTDDGRIVGEMGHGETVLLRWWGLDGERFQRLVRETPDLS